MRNVIDGKIVSILGSVMVAVLAGCGVVTAPSTITLQLSESEIEVLDREIASRGLSAAASDASACLVIHISGLGNRSSDRTFIEDENSAGVCAGAPLYPGQFWGVYNYSELQTGVELQIAPHLKDVRFDLLAFEPTDQGCNRDFIEVGFGSIKDNFNNRPELIYTSKLSELSSSHTNVIVLQEPNESEQLSYGCESGGGGNSLGIETIPHMGCSGPDGCGEGETPKMYSGMDRPFIEVFCEYDVRDAQQVKISWSNSADSVTSGSESQSCLQIGSKRVARFSDFVSIRRDWSDETRFKLEFYNSASPSTPFRTQDFTYNYSPRYFGNCTGTGSDCPDSAFGSDTLLSGTAFDEADKLHLEFVGRDPTASNFEYQFLLKDKRSVDRSSLYFVSLAFALDTNGWPGVLATHQKEDLPQSPTALISNGGLFSVMNGQLFGVLNTTQSPNLAKLNFEDASLVTATLNSSSVATLALSSGGGFLGQVHYNTGNVFRLWNSSEAPITPSDGCPVNSLAGIHDLRVDSFSATSPIAAVGYQMGYKIFWNISAGACPTSSLDLNNGPFPAEFSYLPGEPTKRRLVGLTKNASLPIRAQTKNIEFDISRHTPSDVGNFYPPWESPQFEFLKAIKSHDTASGAQDRRTHLLAGGRAVIGGEIKSVLYRSSDSGLSWYRVWIGDSNTRLFDAVEVPLPRKNYDNNTYFEQPGFVVLAKRPPDTSAGETVQLFFLIESESGF